MATLRIKNVSGGPLEIDTGGPGSPVKLANNAEIDLTDKQLGSKAFLEVLEGGKVSFVAVAKPDQDKIDLAMTVLPPVMSGMGKRLANFQGQFVKTQKQLRGLREGYNKVFKVADSQLTAVKSAMPVGYPNVKAAVKNLLIDPKKEDAEVTAAKALVKQLQDDIDALKTAIPKDAAALAQWFTDRTKKEADLKAAQEALAKLNQTKADPLAEDLANIDADAATVAGYVKGPVIGAEIAALADIG